MDLGVLLLEWDVCFSEQIHPVWRNLGSAGPEGRRSVIRAIGSALMLLFMMVFLSPLISGGDVFESVKLFMIVLLPLAVFYLLYKQVARGLKSTIKLGVNGIQIGVLKRSWGDFEYYETNPDETLTLYYTTGKARVLRTPRVLIKTVGNFSQVDYILSQYLVKGETTT